MLKGAVTTILVCVAASASAQGPDWNAVNAEAMQTLEAYVRIPTPNPPGDVTRAADFLVALLQRDGIDGQRSGPGPGRQIGLARLKGDGSGGKAILIESQMA